jgi:hypothetical protein
MGEAAVKRLQLEAGDVEESEPLVLRCPPEGAPRAVVTDDVDPVVARRVVDRVPYRLLLVLTIEARGYAVVEGKGVPGEAPVWWERGGDTLERVAAVGPGGQVQQRAEGAVDQRRRLVEGKVAHVGLA